MRKFIAGDGSDSSAEARDYLATHRALIQPDFYVINAADSSMPGPGQGLLGPYHSYTRGENGYFDSATRTLYWVDSVTDVGDVWHGFDPVLGCGVPGSGSPGIGCSSWVVVINAKGPDGSVAQITTGPLPCSWDGAPDGKIVVTPDFIYVGSGAGDSGYRWHRCGRDGAYSPCPDVSTFGVLADFEDDGWGGGAWIGALAAVSAGWTPDLGFIHISSNAQIFSFGNEASVGTLPNSAVVFCSDDVSLWAVSNGMGGPTVSRIWMSPSGIAITNYALATLVSDAPDDVEYYAGDNSLLFWLGSTLFKWDIGTEAIVASRTLVFAGSGPVAGGALPNGFNFYDPISLAVLPQIANATGLPPISFQNYPFKWWYDPVASILWLQVFHDPDELDVYGLPVSGGADGGPLGKRFLLTDYPSSLVWDYKGKFLTGVISRGEVQSKIGLEADTLDITWSPQDTDVLGDGEIAALAAFGFGLFDNASVEVWRCCMPRPGDLIGSPPRRAKLGDCNTFGAALMFAGRIGDVKPDRTAVKITLTSRLATLNVEVPTNIIEPTNVFAYCSVGQVPQGGAPYFNVVSGSTAMIVYADPATAEELYDGGYLVFGKNSKLAGVHARILYQEVLDGHNVFYLSEALPFAPRPGDILLAYTPMALDASGSKYGGFRWVPSADNSAVII